ncbi:MAG: ankyrin repeat domain-containing protein, partial [Gammaproteobacteria bacterium]|nr:ankyrin repeat domain-containing protein [Gammaproteobacteria bacterium]
MLDLSSIVANLQAGCFLAASDFLETFQQSHTTLTIEERAHLLMIFDWLHQHSLHYPEQHAATIEELDDLVLDEEDVVVTPLNPSSFMHSQPSKMQQQEFEYGFMMLRMIMNKIQDIFLNADKLEHPEQNLSISFSLMDYIFDEDNYHKQLLNNIIVMEWFVKHAQQRQAPYFDRLLQDHTFASLYCPYLDLNLITSPYGECVLTFALKKQVSDEVFDLLIQHGADVNGVFRLPSFMNQMFRTHAARGEDPLLGTRNSQQVLVQAKIVVENKNNPPLMEAIVRGETSKALRLLQAEELAINIETQHIGAVVNQWRYPTPLMMASYLGNMAVVDGLLARSVAINAVDNQHESAIFYALRANQTCILQKLIESGANISQKNIHERGIEDLIRVFAYPYIQRSFKVFTQFSDIMVNYPHAFLFFMDKMLLQEMPTILDVVAKDQLLKVLSGYLVSANKDSSSHGFFRPLEDAGVDTLLRQQILMMYQGHQKPPKIYGQGQMTNIMIMALGISQYQIRKCSHSFEKIYPILQSAHQLYFISQLPDGICAHILSYFSYQMIND